MKSEDWLARLARLDRQTRLLVPLCWFAIALPIGVSVWLALFQPKPHPAASEDPGYNTGYREGAQFAAQAFIDNGAHLAPLKLSGPSCSLSNCLFITLVQPQNAMEFMPGVTNCTIRGGRFYFGMDGRVSTWPSPIVTFTNRVTVKETNFVHRVVDWNVTNYHRVEIPVRVTNTIWMKRYMPPKYPEDWFGYESPHSPWLPDRSMIAER